MKMNLREKGTLKLREDLEKIISEQNEQIESLQKSNQSLMDTCVRYSDEIIRLRRAVTIELGRKAVEILGDVK